MVYWCLYTLRFNLDIYEFYIYFMADGKPFLLFLLVTLTDVIIKVTVADL